MSKKSGAYLAARRLVLPLVPRALYAAQLVRRRAPLWQSAGIVFIHVPRNGGTSINMALYGRFMGHCTAAEVRRWAPSATREIPAFAIARNPWDRLLSAYRFARLGRATDPVDGVAMEYPERYAVGSFASFERFVLEWLPGRDLSREDPVFRPQSDFLTDSRGNLLVNHLGRIEDLGPTLDFLRERLGTRVAFEKTNATGAACSGRRAAYTAEMRDAAAIAYSADDWLGYDF